MERMNNEFRSGPTNKDIMIWYGKVNLISIGFFFLLFMAITIAAASSSGSLEDMVYGILFLTGLFTAAAVFMVPLMMLSGLLVRYLHFSGNKVKLGRTGINTITRRNAMFPVVRNKIPYDSIESIEKGTKSYIRHIRKRTPLSYYARTLTHRIPHAGLYIPQTGPDNLLVLYLKRPIEITNNNMKRLMLMGMKIEKHHVKEVIIDVESRDHKDFLNMLEHCSGRHFGPI